MKTGNPKKSEQAFVFVKFLTQISDFSSICQLKLQTLPCLLKLWTWDLHEAATLCFLFSIQKIEAAKDVHDDFVLLSRSNLKPHFTSPYCRAIGICTLSEFLKHYFSSKYEVGWGCLPLGFWFLGFFCGFLVDFFS